VRLSCSYHSCVCSSVFLYTLYVLMHFSFNKYCYQNNKESCVSYQFCDLWYETSTYINLHGLDLVQFLFKAHQICFEFWGWTAELIRFSTLYSDLCHHWRSEEMTIEQFSIAVALIRSTPGFSSRSETVLNAFSPFYSVSRGWCWDSTFNFAATISFCSPTYSSLMKLILLGVRLGGPTEKERTHI
jgi:hypothetical protein